MTILVNSKYKNNKNLANFSNTYIIRLDAANIHSYVL